MLPLHPKCGSRKFLQTTDVRFYRTPVVIFVFIEWQISRKFLLFMESNIYYLACKTRRRILKRANRIQCIYFLPVPLKVHLINIFQSIHTHPRQSLLPSYCPSKDIYICLLPYVWYMLIIHPDLLDGLRIIELSHSLKFSGVLLLPFSWVDTCFWITKGKR
jgi:hypothetical protein